jgi:uncharacterized protein
MIIKGFIWLTDIVDKIEAKHGVEISEAEYIFIGNPVFNRIKRGHVKGEDIYRVLGQTETGRYLAVFFIHKESNEALVISARDMTNKERRLYATRKK